MVGVVETGNELAMSFPTIPSDLVIADCEQARCLVLVYEQALGLRTISR
jgi:hypothetical protein